MKKNDKEIAYWHCNFCDADSTASRPPVHCGFIMSAVLKKAKS